MGVVEIACAFFLGGGAGVGGGGLLGDSNAEKWIDQKKKKVFINKSVEALIPLKEGYQGLLKLRVPGSVPARTEK